MKHLWLWIFNLANLFYVDIYHVLAIMFPIKRFIKTVTPSSQYLLRSVCSFYYYIDLTFIRSWKLEPAWKYLLFVWMGSKVVVLFGPMNSHRNWWCQPVSENLRTLLLEVESDKSSHSLIWMTYVQVRKELNKRNKFLCISTQDTFSGESV